MKGENWIEKVKQNSSSVQICTNNYKLQLCISGLLSKCATLFPGPAQIAGF